MNGSDPLARALDAARRGRSEEARNLCEEVLSGQPDSHPALYLLGVIAAQDRRFEEAAGHFQRATELSPETGYFVNFGNVCRILGRLDQASEAFARALEQDPDNLVAAKGLAFSSMPGDGYEVLLRRFHELLTPAVYLEIGVETGRTLALARPPTRALGVDPDPKIQVAFEAETQIFPLTSNEFFATVDTRETTGPVDLAFLDGLHLFEQTLKDFMGVERAASARAVVLVHDCFPLNRRIARRERSSDFWTGDPWKLIPVLRRYRPDLTPFVVASAPTGLGVITGLDPDNRVLEDSWDEIMQEFLDMELPEDGPTRAQQLAVVANDWDAILTRLGRD